MGPSVSCLFDACIVVDWSANRTPKIGRDSIWIAEARRAGARVRVGPPRNPPTRAAAYDLICRALLDHVQAGHRVLIAFDFVYGFPCGFADALALAGPGPRWLRTWRALTEAITDEDTDANNRWAVAEALNRRLGSARGPFWNCPRAVATPYLSVTKGRFPHVVGAGTRLAEYRAVDALIRRFRASLQSVWKLYTTGSVGSQTLLGIPRLHALTTHPGLARWSRVWPFETGFAVDQFPEAGPFILHAEAWPRIVPEADRPALVRDARQVIALARHFAELDGAGKLAPLFERPATLGDAGVAACCDEEGWVLGA
jgi:hypothetical protein